jgi:hypothetical protein
MGAVMSEIITVELDRAENVFQVHGADRAGRPVLPKTLRPTQVLEFLGLGVTSPKVVWLFLEQIWSEFVPVFHGLQGRFAAQC